MRKRFEPQRELGQLLIEDTSTLRSRDGMVSLVVALWELYKNKEYRDRIPDILEAQLLTGKPKTGRPGNAGTATRQASGIVIKECDSFSFPFVIFSLRRRYICPIKPKTLGHDSFQRYGKVRVVIHILLNVAATA